jgi:cell division protease FtsH
MAKALLEYETLDADQIGDIMSGKPPRPPKPSGGSQSAAKPPASDGGTEGATAPAPTA